jgi:hypothetical protein
MNSVLFLCIDYKCIFIAVSANVLIFRDRTYNTTVSFYSFAFEYKCRLYWNFLISGLIFFFYNLSTALYSVLTKSAKHGLNGPNDLHADASQHVGLDSHIYSKPSLIRLQLIWIEVWKIKTAVHSWAHSLQDIWHLGWQMSHLSVQTNLDSFFKPALLPSKTSKTSESSIDE